jgi:hypothetical protein
MSDILTVEELLQVSETEVELPALSHRLGGRRIARVRRISALELWSVLPPPPPGAEAWPAAERAAQEQAWLEGLPAEAREAREASLRDVHYRIVNLASLDPRLSLEQARHLGNDAVAISSAVLALSDLLGGAAPDTQEAERDAP